MPKKFFAIILCALLTISAYAGQDIICKEPYRLTREVTKERKK
jgi:hypothetical protein